MNRQSNTGPDRLAPLWRTPECARIRAEHRRRFEEVFAGGSVEPYPALHGLMAGRSHGLWGTNEIDMLAEPEAWLADVLSDIDAHAEEALDRRTFRPFVIELDALGTHFIDALFGADVHFHEGQVWSAPLGVRPRDLRMPDRQGNGVLRRSLRLARLAVEAAQGVLFVSTPVLSCPINIAVNLFGQDILTEMVEDPDGARSAYRIITDVIAECWRRFLAVIPADQRVNSVGADRYAPPGFGFIDGCATQLVSARHYRDFLAPLDAELLGMHPRGGQIHLCGSHTHLIPVWREMKELRSVQLNDRAADDLAAYHDGLRNDQVLYVMPTEATPVERIVEITGGKRVVVQALV